MMENKPGATQMFGAQKAGAGAESRPAEDARTRVMPNAAPRPAKNVGGGVTRRYKGRAPAPNGTSGEIKDFLRRYNIAIIVVASLTVLTLLAALLLPVFLNMGQGGVDVTGASATQTAQDPSQAGEEELTDEDYDPNAALVDVEKYPDTVLQLSEQASEAYVTETLFLGDSNTERLLAYRDVTLMEMQNCIGYVGMGVTEFSSLRFVKLGFANGTEKTVTLPEAIAYLQPQRIVLNYGTNNATMGVSAFIGSYRKMIEKIRESYEYADIIIASVLPVDKHHTYGSTISQKRVDEFNAALVELAAEMDCKFLNWSEALKDAATGFAETDNTVQDGIHLSRTGAEKLIEYFRTHSYITEDRRPKPLNEVPERKGTVPNLIVSDPTKVEGTPTPTPAPKEVELLISVYNDTEKKAGGGTLKYGDQNKGSYTVKVAPLDSIGQIVAVPDEGYQFAYWSCTHGRIEDNTDPTLPGYTMPGHVEPGSSADLIAHFVKVAQVPNLMGLDYDAGAVSADGWEIVVERRYDASRAKGIVIDQSPAAGTKLATDDAKRVTIVVSDGAEPAPTPTPTPEATPTPEPPATEPPATEPPTSAPAEPAPPAGDAGG